jgi:chemotaxis protein CheX
MNNKHSLKASWSRMSQYLASEKDGIHMVTFPAIVEADKGNLEAVVKSWMVNPANIHVFDLRDTTAFKQSSYRAFVLFNQALKANGKILFSINVSPKLALQFKQDGLVGVFNPVASLEEARRRSQPARPTADVEFINPFIVAAKNVLETQAQLKLTPGRAYLRKHDERIPMEIAGVIGISCSEFTGSISLCFRAEVFLKIYEGLVGEKHQMISNEIHDAAGELLNIIFGQAKTVLNDQRGYKIDKAIPTVLVGEKLKLHHQSRNPSIVLPFESPAGAFHLEILVEQS